MREPFLLRSKKVSEPNKTPKPQQSPLEGAGAPDQELTEPFGGMGPLELCEAHMKSQWAPRAAGGPYIKRKQASLKIMGPPGARWGPGPRANCSLEQAWAPYDPYGRQGLLNEEQTSLLEDYKAPGARWGPGEKS